MNQLDQVRELAREYRTQVARGDVTGAGETRRTIDNFPGVSGTYVGGRWTLYAWVREEMGEVKS